MDGVLPDRFLACEAGERGEGRVDPLDRPVAGRDDDGVPHAVEGERLELDLGQAGGVVEGEGDLLRQAAEEVDRPRVEGVGAPGVDREGAEDGAAGGEREGDGSADLPARVAIPPGEPNEESRSASTLWTIPVRMVAPVIPPVGGRDVPADFLRRRAGRVRSGEAAQPDGAVVLAPADGDEGEAEDVGDAVADEGVDRVERLALEEPAVHLGQEREDLLVLPHLGPVDADGPGVPAVDRVGQREARPGDGLHRSVLRRQLGLDVPEAPSGVLPQLAHPRPLQRVGIEQVEHVRVPEDFLRCVAGDPFALVVPEGEQPVPVHGAHEDGQPGEDEPQLGQLGPERLELGNVVEAETLGKLHGPPGAGTCRRRSRPERRAEMIRNREAPSQEFSSAGPERAKAGRRNGGRRRFP